MPFCLRNIDLNKNTYYTSSSYDNCLNHSRPTVNIEHCESQPKKSIPDFMCKKKEKNVSHHVLAEEDHEESLPHNIKLPIEVQPNLGDSLWITGVTGPSNCHVETTRMLNNSGNSRRKRTFPRLGIIILAHRYKYGSRHVKSRAYRVKVTAQMHSGIPVENSSIWSLTTWMIPVSVTWKPSWLLESKQLACRSY